MAEKQNATKILGIDLSPNMILEARSRCKSAEFKCADLFTTPIEEKTFDAIICSLVLGYIEHLTPTLDNLLKALRTEGVLIITDFHPFLSLMQAKRTFKDQQL
jgi:ubiquinone/menaquinone biosynthesis C-methylase UbiE